MSSENRKKNRNKSKNRNKKCSPSSVVAVASTGQSVGERLRSAVQVLQRYGNFVDLRNEANHWIKLATQVLSNPVTAARQVQDASSAALLLLYILERCRPSSGDASSKMQLSPQLLLPCARAAVLQAGPQDLANLPCLLMFRQLLSTHPGLCSPIKDQLERKLKGWLNIPPESILEDRLYSGSSKLPRSHLATSAINDDVNRVDGDGSNVALAADVWALMPLANSAGAADDDQHQTKASKADGLTAARGKQLKQLLLTLQHTLDGLLGNVVQAQGSESLTNLTGIPLLKFLPSGKQKNSSALAKKINNKINNIGDDTTKMEDELLEDDISDPLERVQVSFNRCCGLLVFVERLLMSVTKGANASITLVTRDVLLPLFRILQVSASALHRYHSAEVQKLAKLWPALQHRALHTLHAALLSLGPHLFSWYHLIQDQLTNTLLAVPNAKTALAPAKSSGATKTSDDRSTSKGGEEQHFGLEKLGLSWDVMAQQETVRLVYLCLGKLAKVSRNMHGTPLPLAKAIFADLSPQPNNDASLQIPSKKSIASMSIKKKSKRKGYTISTSQPPSITLTNTHRSSLSSSHVSSTENTIENLRQPFANLSHEKSAQIVSNALDLLQLTITCDQHYVLSADTATLIVESIVRLARKYCGITDILTCRFYPSVSGLVDLRALLSSQQLMAKLFRLLPLLVVHLHPAFPPPAAELQFILQEGARIHAANEPVSQACEDGLRQIGSFMSNPSMAAFLDNIEKMKISEFNKSELGGGLIQDELDNEEEEVESDAEMVADDDNDEDDDSNNEDEKDNSEDTETTSFNGLADAGDDEQQSVELDEEELSSEEANVTNQSEAISDDGDDNEASESADGSATEQDGAHDKENQTPAGLDGSDDAETPPPLETSTKKKRKTPSGVEGKQLKKKRKVSISGKAKGKKPKISSSVKVVPSAEDDEREEGDLSVADMLSELLD